MSDFFHWIHEFLIHHTLLAPFLFIALHVLFAICLIPCSPMALIAGLLWGAWGGLGLSILAAFLSCCMTFCLSRIFLKQKIYQFIHKRYAKTDWFLEQTSKHGWKFVAAVQLNPAAPASTLGYLFGLTHIDFLVYAKYLIIFMLPLQIIFVSVGDSASSMYYDGQIFRKILELSLIVGASCFIYQTVRRRAKKWSVLSEE